jgi:hypothetical protein
VGDGRQLHLLAAVLAALGVRLTVVGSAARALDGQPVHPHDLDVAIDDTLENRSALRAALGMIGARKCRIDRYDTPFGPVDVFYGRPRGRAHTSIAGVTINYAV